MDILPRIIADNEEELTFPSNPLRSECLLQLNDLKRSLECGNTGELRGLSDEGPDVLLWDKMLFEIPKEERNWLNAPWVLTEFYLYRRIAEAFKFFETGYDMFLKQKRAGLIDALPFIDEIASGLPDLLASEDKAVPLEMAVVTSLWGNKMDLSLWPSASTGEGTATDRLVSQGASSSIRSFILDDHTDEVVSLLMDLVKEGSGVTPREVGIIVDNAGYELVSDLMLGHILLQTGAVDVVTFHTKGHPTFVSDATTEDTIETINFLKNHDDGTTASAKLGAAMSEYVSEGKFRLVDDLFWCQPTPFWSPPAEVQDKLQGCRLTFVKGDANYRRLLGERAWPLDTPAKAILQYWAVLGSPVCALRTFKAEIGCGVNEEQQHRAQTEDKDWMVDGKWGVVQIGGVN